jgi:hypothetical protein
MFTPTMSESPLIKGMMNMGMALHGKRYGNERRGREISEVCRND